MKRIIDLQYDAVIPTALKINWYYTGIAFIQTKLNLDANKETKSYVLQIILTKRLGRPATP